MPLNTQIIRNGENLSLRWGGFHVAAMAIASTLDQPLSEWKLWEAPEKVQESIAGQGYPENPMPITPSMAFSLADYGALSLTPLNEGSYTLTQTHRFIDVTDDEVLELLPGDVLRAWREF